MAASAPWPGRLKQTSQLQYRYQEPLVAFLTQEDCLAAWHRALLHQQPVAHTLLGLTLLLLLLCL